MTYTYHLLRNEDAFEKVECLLAIPWGVDANEVQEFILKYRDEHYYKNNEDTWYDTMMEQLDELYGIEEESLCRDFYY